MSVSVEPKYGRRSAGRVATVAVINLLLLLVLLEAALRLLRVTAPRLPYDNNVAHLVLGMAPEPAKRWKANFPEYGGPLYMQTNNRGFYEERDTAIEKAPGTVRLVVLGDSQTVGTCTPAENYPNVLENRLNRLAGSARYEVIDAGVGRYSPYQYYVRLREDIVPLKPDHVVIAIYAGNDFLDLLRRDDRPYVTIERDGSFRENRPWFLVYDDPARPPSLLERLRVYQLGKAALGPTVLYQISRVRLLFNLAATRHGADGIARYMLEVAKLSGIAKGAVLQSLNQQVWFRHFPETLPEAFAVNRYVMAKARDLCARHNIRLTYVIIPSKPMIEPEDMRGTFERLHHAGPDVTIEAVQSLEGRAIRQAIKDAAELGISAIDLRDEMRRRRQGRRLYYTEDLHLNVEGNKVVGEILEKTLGQPL